jgi:hypothetical protein
VERGAGADEEEHGGGDEWWCWHVGIGADAEAAGYVGRDGSGGRRGGRGGRRGRKMEIWGGEGLEWWGPRVGMQNRETVGAIYVLGMKIFLLHPQ